MHIYTSKGIRGIKWLISDLVYKVVLKCRCCCRKTLTGFIRQCWNSKNTESTDNKFKHFIEPSKWNDKSDVDRVRQLSDILSHNDTKQTCYDFTVIHNDPLLAGKLCVPVEMVHHGVEGLMFLMTESSKHMVTHSHSDTSLCVWNGWGSLTQVRAFKALQKGC